MPPPPPPGWPRPSRTPRSSLGWNRRAPSRSGRPIVAPTRIAIGGGLVGAGETLLQPLRDGIHARLTFQREPEIVADAAHAILTRLDTAIDDFNHALALDPNDPAIYYNRGNALVAAGWNVAEKKVATARATDSAVSRW